jgi:hypothetical protein
VRRELDAMLCKLFSSQAELEFEEHWSVDGERRHGRCTMQIVGKPVSVTAEFELLPQGKGCVHRIEHQAKARVPLIGGVVEKFVLEQTRQGCA